MNKRSFRVNNFIFSEINIYVLIYFYIKKTQMLVSNNYHKHDLSVMLRIKYGIINVYY